MYITEIESRVAGIPCIIGVTSWEPYRPAFISGSPDSCYPAEGGCAEWRVLDRNGRLAKWLERKVTDDDIERIDDQIAEYFA